MILLHTGPIRKYIAFFFLYFGWGSLYFAIGLSVRTIPPFLLAGASSVLAGSLLMLLSRAPNPSRREWRASLWPSVSMIVLGNGAVVWGEQYVPSMVTALILATEPAWLLILDRKFFKGPKVSVAQMVGIVLGILGVGVLLVGHHDQAASWPRATDRAAVGTLAILMAAVGWTLGSLMCRSEDMPKNSAMAIALPVLMGGVILLLLSFFSGEMSRFSLSRVSTVSMAAFWYIVLICYVGTYWSYIWLLKNAPLAQVSSYAYINPLLAAVLGVLIGGEYAGAHVIFGGALIVSATFLILKFEKKERAA